MPAMLKADELVDRKSAAAFLHVSQATLSRWMKERVGPPVVKLTDGDRGRVLYRSVDLVAFVESRTLRPKSGIDILPGTETVGAKRPAIAGRRKAKGGAE